MTTIQASGSLMSIGDALLTAVMGYAMVFVGIILLIIVVSIVAAIMKSTVKKPAPAAAPAPDKSAPVEPLVKTGPAAPGSAGELKLYDTDPKVAAMIMAIVADKTGTPLNELRFKSIKEVK